MFHPSCLRLMTLTIITFKGGKKTPETLRWWSLTWFIIVQKFPKKDDGFIFEVNTKRSQLKTLAESETLSKVPKAALEK